MGHPEAASKWIYRFHSVGNSLGQAASNGTKSSSQPPVNCNSIMRLSFLDSSLKGFKIIFRDTNSSFLMSLWLLLIYRNV